MKMIKAIACSGLRVCVKEINWERVHLTLRVSLRYHAEDHPDLSKLDFYLVDLETGKAKVKFKKTIIDDQEVSLKINITNVGNKAAVPVGTYSLLVCMEEQVLAETEVSETIVGTLEDVSRGFLYKMQSYAYNMKFYVADDEDALKLRIRVLNSSIEEMVFPDNPRFFYEFARLVKHSFLDAHVIVRWVYRFFSLFYKKRRSHNVLFFTEQSKTLKSNLKAVSERMYERNLDQEYHIFASCRKVADKTQGGISWIKTAITLAKSGIIFVDDHAPVLDWLKLGSDVKVFQLWHAGAGFKSSGYSRWGQIGPPGPVSAHRQYTYGIAGSKLIAPFFSEVWGINDECVLPTGMPRMDEFLDDSYRQQKVKELEKLFPVIKEKKVILFGPTYRGKSAEDAYYPYHLIDFDKLSKVCGDEYVVFFKMHPWVIKDISIPEKYKDIFFDVKDYPNINDLFYVTDLLITDYSSNIFEFSLMRKPMLFFAYDKIQYAFSRGFHRAYEESAPGKVVYNFDELLNAIADKDFEFEKVEEYVEHHFDYIDSQASDRVIDWFLLGKMPEKFKEEIELKEQEMKTMKKLDFSDFIVV